ncbi:MAG: hypothetical protein ACLR43_14100 [Faecalibacillus faecis]
MVKHGIDVSKFQGLIDWQEVKNILILQSLDVGMEVIWKVKTIRILKEMRMNVHV